jgi:hypothetical protein
MHTCTHAIIGARLDTGYPAIPEDFVDLRKEKGRTVAPYGAPLTLKWGLW